MQEDTATPAVKQHKAVYEKPIFLSKKQIRTIAKGKIIRIKRGGYIYIDIGLKGYTDPAIITKIEHLKKEIARLQNKT